MDNRQGYAGHQNTDLFGDSLSDSSKIPSRDQRNPLGKIRPSNIKTRPVELRPRQDATDTKPHQKDFIPRPTEVGPRSLLPDPIVNTSNKHQTRDWNEEFQELMTALQNPNSDFSDIFLRLSLLGNDFLYAAKAYAQIIFSEYSLDDDSKAIKSKDAGGIAGGMKYICNNIFFKFAVDNKNLYGGVSNSIKAAGHELRYLAELIEANVSGLHFPLMCTIDWCGFRLSGVSLIPIDKQTLIYGSTDGGNTIANKDPAFERKMEELAKKLNLARHLCGMKGTKEPKYLFTAIDMEGHKGKDNRYYIIDTARLFPPEFLEKETRERLSKKYSKPTRFYLFLHLRPELVRKWKTPLNPDMLSGFSEVAYEKDKTTWIKQFDELEECSKSLRESVIPNFVESLCTKYEDRNVVELEFFTFNRLILDLHHAGINIRYLGLVKKCLEDYSNKKNANVDSTARSSYSCLKEMILTEMICRVLKNELNDKLREEIQRLKVPSLRPLNEITIHLFNRILSSANFWSLLEYSESSPITNQSRFAQTLIKKLIIEKFGSEALNEVEMNHNTNIAPRHSKKLISRLEDLTGVKLRGSSKQNLEYTFMKQAQQVRHPLSVEDIKFRDVRVKHLPFISYSNAIFHYHQAMQTEDKSSKFRLLKKAIRHFDTSRLLSLYSPDRPALKFAMNVWGDTLREYAMLTKLNFNVDDPILENFRLIKRTRLYFEMALEKYQKTNDPSRILKLAQNGTRTLLNLVKEYRRELERQKEFSIENVLKEVVIFVETMLTNYEQQWSSSENAGETAAQWGSILYEMATVVTDPNKSKVFRNLSGKYYLKSLQHKPTLFPSLSTSWVNKIREDEVAFVFNIANKTSNREKITIFNSAWAPKMSFETFTATVQNSSLNRLVLDGNQTGPQFAERLPSLAQYFTNLQELNLNRYGNLTSESVKQTVRCATQLQSLIIHNCRCIDPKQFLNFTVGDNKEVDVMIEFQKVSKASPITPAKGYFSVNTSALRQSRKLQRFLDTDKQIYVALIEYTKELKHFYTRCKPDVCTQFVVSGTQIVWQNKNLPPHEYYKEFVPWVWGNLKYQPKDNEENIVMPDPSELQDWPTLKQRIYRSLFYLYLHLAKTHPNERFHGGNFSFFSKALEVVKLREKDPELLRPQEWTKHDDTIRFIEQQGTIPGMNPEDDD